ncbi:cupin domain-containing protein [Pseudomonas sp. Pseusp122]|uniref:AraC family transcriptional regulator n=1 Tax=unclassified Pseudomonas TaxID=196821 RepID=UPI0039A56E15
MDRLSTLLNHFGVSAGTFHSGEFCNAAAFDADGRHGHLHVLRSGVLGLRLADNRELTLSEPTLIFFPRAYAHRLTPAPGESAQIVCASLDFAAGSGNPIAAALPDYLLLPLSSSALLGPTLEWLFAEAFGDMCGREAVMDRLFELLVIQLLRYLLNEERLGSGMLAGLADLRLAKALNLMHAMPQQAWTVGELAEAAGMSRASFAAHFHEVVGQPPAEYLLSWRVSLAQKRLREGRPIALIADEVGYESPSALARAFRRRTGSSPRQWLQTTQNGL